MMGVVMAKETNRVVFPGLDDVARFQEEVFSGKHDSFFKTMGKMIDGKKMSAKDIKVITKALNEGQKHE